MAGERDPTQTGGRAATTGVIPGHYALSVGKPATPMPKGWQWVPLTDVARLETGHTPSRRYPEYWEGDVPWIGIKDATSNHGRIISDTFQHTNELGIQNSSARILPTHTVCLSRTASIGYVVVMGRPMATSQDFVNWVCSDKLDYRFLKSVLLAESDSFPRFASGTTHQTIYFPEVKAFHICLPPLAEQRAIAHILGTLDDKIELNRRTNETLEGMARAIFKSWFVDFDPVRAKAEGRDPGLPKSIANLFPDSFEDSELGKIPKGWKAAPLRELTEITIGGDWGKDDHFDGSVEAICLRGVDLERLRINGWADAPRRWIKASSSAKRQLEERDVLIAGSGAGPTGRPLWASSQLGHLWGLPVIYSNFCKRLRCHSKNSAIYIDRWLHTMRESGEIWEYVNGTSLPNLDANALLRGKWIVVPSERVLQSFARIIEPLSQKLFSTESRTLAALRDTLLPKLLSGEIRVGEAEKIVEGVA